MHNTLTHNSLTKQITFMPFYVLVNKAPYTIEVQENNRPGDAWLKVEENQCIPFWPKSNSEMLRVKAADDNDVSRPFKLSDMQCMFLRLNNKVSAVNLEVTTPVRRMK